MNDDKNTHSTPDDINQSFQDYQDFLTIKERRLKIPVVFDNDALDPILDMLSDSTPDLTGTPL